MNLWDCLVISLVALALWWGSRMGFAAQLFEMFAILGGATLGCIFYANFAGFLKSTIGMEDYSASYWGFIGIFGGFWLLLSTQKHRFKRMVLKMPPSLDTVLGVVLSLAFAVVLIGVMMLTVAWMPSGDLYEKVAKTSFFGPNLADLMPKVYHDSLNPTAVRLNFESSKEGGLGLDYERKEGSVKTIKEGNK